MGLYKSKRDRIADTLLANVSTSPRLTPIGRGQLRCVETSGQEREALKEQQAESIARLAIDNAMK